MCGHLCPNQECALLITQAEYLAVAEQGRWQNADGSITIDAAGVFRNAAGAVIAPLKHIAFHVWAAYSPVAIWSDLVNEFLEAFEKAQSGDITKLKTFTNTTLGLQWGGQAVYVKKIPVDVEARRQPIRARYNMANRRELQAEFGISRGQFYKDLRSADEAAGVSSFRRKETRHTVTSGDHTEE